MMVLFCFPFKNRFWGCDRLDAKHPIYISVPWPFNVTIIFVKIMLSHAESSQSPLNVWFDGLQWQFVPHSFSSESDFSYGRQEWFWMIFYKKTCIRSHMMWLWNSWYKSTLFTVIEFTMYFFSKVQSFKVKGQIHQSICMVFILFQALHNTYMYFIMRHSYLTHGTVNSKLWHVNTYIYVKVNNVGLSQGQTIMAPYFGYIAAMFKWWNLWHVYVIIKVKIQI